MSSYDNFGSAIKMKVTGHNEIDQLLNYVECINEFDRTFKYSPVFSLFDNPFLLDKQIP